MPVYLLPLVVRFLTDTNNQVGYVFQYSNNQVNFVDECVASPHHDLLKVRKTSQAALLVLLEQGLADTRDVEDQVFIANSIDWESA